MKLIFELIGEDREEMELMDEFCEQLVIDIRRDIYNNVIPSKMECREEDILSANWIDWIKKPSSLNVMTIVNLIIDKIGYMSRKNTFVICVSPKAKLPNSNTSLDSIARFLDKGNEDTPYTVFISKFFNDYTTVKINNYWEAFIFAKLNRECIDSILVSN